MALSYKVMTSLSGELRKLVAAFSQIHTPLLVIRGGKDSLVDPMTADDVEKWIPKSG